MNRVWVFGCSHTNTCGINEDEFWGKLLADKLGLRFRKLESYVDDLNGLNIDFNGKTGQWASDVIYGDGGCGIDVIQLHAMTIVHLGLIKPNDVIIFNASYSTRIHSTHLVHSTTQDKNFVNTHTDLIKHFEDTFMTATVHIPEEKKHWIRKEDKVSLNYKHELTLFAQWYLRQKFTYEMLKQTGAEIYQWLLEPKYILEELLNAVDEDMIHTEWQQNKSQAFECAYSLLKQKHTGWENLLECPEIEARHYESKKKAKVECWSDVFSEVHPLQYRRDGHQNPQGHKFMAETFYKQILKYRDENR